MNTSRAVFPSRALLTISAILFSCGGNNVPGGENESCIGDGCSIIYDQGYTDGDPGNGNHEIPQDPDIPPDDDNDNPDVDPCLGVNCPGGFGCQCDFNTDCDSGWCVIVDAVTGERKCTVMCYEDCPCEWECQNVGMVGSDPLFLCMPRLDPLCNLECLKDTDCALGNLCVKMETHQFCLQACGEGIEQCPEDYECVETENWDASDTALQCSPLSGHCSCDPDVDYLSDVDHCGSCENNCVYDNGYADCQEGVCKLIGCEEGYVNLNGIPDDGCEYECSFKGPEDLPDPGYNDDNCDGIDGNIDNGVFVDGDKGDDDNLVGDMAHPFKTINAAIGFADGKDPKLEVYTSKGQYQEQIQVLDGVSVYGGYDSSLAWKRNIDEHKAMIMWDGQESLAVRTVIATEIVGQTVFDGFWIKTSSAVQATASSYGVYIFHSSSGLVISNNHIEAGNGADGQSGSHGQNGGNGNDGGKGSDSFGYDGWLCAFCTCVSNYQSYNIGGYGGGSPCGMVGGKGGKGGEQDHGGSDGSNAPNNGGQGGDGAPSEEDPGKPGKDGTDGNNGINGAGGTSVGSLNPSGLWVGNPGLNGEDGLDGKGGGGGGGGGGDTGSWFLGLDCDSMGGAGGGGGGGGCGGDGGVAGTAGGGSFGVFIVEASPTITGNSISTASGGNGGVGGYGGEAGTMGSSGSGGSGIADDDPGPGGAGGDGGHGGKGGAGGGGAGGPTYGLYILGTSSNPSCNENEFQVNGFPGSGGPGGSGSGSNSKGENGQSGSVFGTAPDCPAQ